MFNSDNNFWYFVRTKFHIIMTIVMCIITLILLFVLIGIKVPESKIVESEIGVVVSKFDDEALLIHDSIKGYLVENPYEISAEKVYKSTEGNRKIINKGLAVTISYDIQNLHAGVFVKNAELQISEDKDFNNSRTIYMSENSVDVYHLKTGTKYYYRVVVELSDNKVMGEASTFSTVDTPRIMNIDGALNVRDIGGWKVSDGKKIKQGLLYRGSEIDGAVEKFYKITDVGLNDMLNVLCIRSDFDLRNPDVNKEKTDALGSSVKHTYYNAPQYAAVFLSENKEIMRSVFSDLADKNNYPVYLHCTYGRDRTGTVCAILEALLGVSKEDIKRDYELSSFSYGELDREWFDDFLEQLDEFDGETLQESTENYLKSVGVTEGEIQNIKDLFIGE